MKYVIFSDIDGTIYPSSKEIHPQTIEDVQKAQDANIEFVISTGNGYFKNIKKLSEKFNARYAITSNGASIFDRTENKFIFTSTIPKNKAQKLLDFSIENEISGCWWDEQKVYANKYVPNELIEIIKKVMTIDEEPEVSNEIKNDIFKIEFYDESEKIDKIVSFMNGMDLQQARMQPRHVEVTHTNVSKGDAIKWMSKEFDIDLINTMGIGDSPNDIKMFETVEHSYAMANSTESAKEAAKHHTSSVEQNGLGEAIRDFMYRKKIGDYGK